MDAEPKIYLACLGLRRLIVYAVGSPHREQPSEHGLKCDDVAERCRLEVDEREEPKFTPEALSTAWDDVVRRERVLEQNECVRLSSSGWQASGRDFDAKPLPQVPSDSALSIDDACQLILRMLTEAKTNEQYRYDPRVNRFGEVTLAELRVWVGMLGLSEEHVTTALGALLAHGLVRAVPTGPDAELSLFAATDAGLKGRVLSLQADQHLMESVIVQHVESAEADAYQRAHRVPDMASRGADALD